MADKTPAQQASDNAAKAAEDQDAIEKAVTPSDAPKRSPGEQKAEDLELARQKTVVEAVAEAHDAQLPKLGGPLMDPGLGR